jgi:hypothetical protein
MGLPRVLSARFECLVCVAMLSIQLSVMACVYPCRPAIHSQLCEHTANTGRVWMGASLLMSRRCCVATPATPSGSALRPRWTRRRRRRQSCSVVAATRPAPRGSTETARLQRRRPRSPSCTYACRNWRQRRRRRVCRAHDLFLCLPSLSLPLSVCLSLSLSRSGHSRALARKCLCSATRAARG